MIRIPASAAARACPARLSARCHVDRTLPASLASSTSFASGRFNTFPRRSLAQGHPRVRWASSSAYQPPTDLSTRSFAVIGAGTLGRRIALMWLTQGRAVHLFDSNQKALDDAQAFINRELETTIQRHVAGGKPGCLRVFTDREATLQGAWIVTECIPEIRNAKIKLLGELDSELPSNVILATNSSSFMANELYENVKNRDRLVNMHYYMPPNSRAVEIMPCADTDKRIAPLLMKESSKHGLIPFLARKESVGLIANRIWAAIKRESVCVVADGVAEPAEIDQLLCAISGTTSGPFQAMDRVGLDVVLDIEQHYLAVRPDLRPDAADYLRKYVNEGKLGMKTGEGFYKYERE